MLTFVLALASSFANMNEKNKILPVVYKSFKKTVHIKSLTAICNDFITLLNVFLFFPQLGCKSVGTAASLV